MRLDVQSIIVGSLERPENLLSNLADSVKALEDRRAALEAELAQVNQRLNSINAALGAPARRGRPPGGGKAVAKAAPGKKLKNRSWFEPGEAVALMKKIATKPMRPSELIKQLGVVKGYAGKLGKPDMNRFTWAATSAVKAALAAKQLLRRNDGSLSAAK